MSNVFISYSAQSRDAVKALAQDIRALEHPVWYDQELLGGHAWWDRILQEIRKCDAFVFALSPEALDSIPCRLEYTYASALGKPILPVLVADGVSTEVLPPALSAVQHIDYRASDKRAAFALVKALTALPAPGPLPNPLPPPPALPGAFLGAFKQQIEEAETLSFREQSELVVKLKDRLRDSAQAPEVRKLLLRLRQRDDLYAKVAEEIDAILGDARQAAPDQGNALGHRREQSPKPPQPDRLVVPMPTGRGHPFLRMLGFAFAGFLVALGVAALRGERYLGSAQLWEVDMWVLWPIMTVILASGYLLLRFIVRRVMG